MTLNVKTTEKTYAFDGPYSSAEDLKKTSGVYVITTKNNSGSHIVIDVGESDNIRKRVMNHDRAKQWPRYKQNGIYMSGYPCDEPARMRIETELRDYFNPSCGDK